MTEKVQTTGFWKQLLYTCIVYSTFSLIGITRGFSTFWLQQLLSPTSDIQITMEQGSWIASLSIFPNPIGSILIGILMDRVGRKVSLRLSTIFFVIGWSVVAFSKSIFHLYIGDVIIGVAIGMSLCSSVYVAEISELQYRCMLLSFFIIFFSMGVLISYVLTCYFTWRFSAMTFSISSALVCIMLHYIPESPYWYMKNGRLRCAIKSIEKLRGGDKVRIETECQEIMYTLSHKKKNHFSIVNLIRNWKPFSIFVMFQVCLQGSGYSVLVTYLASIFTEFDLPFDTKKLAIGYSVFTFASSFLSPLTVNFWNRKSVMKISGSGMTLAMLLVLLYQVCPQLQTEPLAAMLVPAGLYLYVFTSTIGAVTLSESMPSELYSTEVRGMMCGITEAFSTILTGLCIKMYPLLQMQFDMTYTITGFAFFSFMTLLFGIFVLPETHGKSLLEIQDSHFNKKRRIQPSIQA